MNEIPEDIKATADEVSRKVGAIWNDEPIALAILAERNRCSAMTLEEFLLTNPGATASYVNGKLELRLVKDGKLQKLSRAATLESVMQGYINPPRPAID